MAQRLSPARRAPRRLHAARRPGERLRLAAAVALAAALVALAGVLVACGDGSAPVPPTRTLTPDQSPGSPGSGSTAAPSEQPASRPSAFASPPAAVSPAPTASPAQARVSDRSIKANILARIAREAGLRGFDIKVAVSSRAVYLRGRVRTKEQRSLVERIALTEPGVKKVVSAIDVDDAAGY